MSDPDFVNSLARGLDVLGAFGKGNAKMTLTQVAERTGLTRGTARRFLLTLCRLGYVGSNEKLYWLTPKVLKFSSNYLATFGLGESAYASIQQLTDTLGQTSSMSVLDDDEIVYVARVEKYRVYSNRIEVGTRLPAHSTSMGLVLLSGMTDDELDAWLSRNPLVRFTDNTIVDRRKLKKAVQDVRACGYAVSEGTLELGVRSMSVPIRDRAGSVIAAINVVVFAANMSNDDMTRQFLSALQDTARQIGHLLSAD